MKTDLLHIEQLFSADQADDYAAFYSIYRQSLLISEQKPENEIKSMISDPKYRVMLGRFQDNVIGFSVIYVSEENHFALLEYMAVAAQYRSHGFGSQLFTQSHHFLTRSLGVNIPLLLEVDSPLEDDASDNDRVKRLRFYQRLGCKTIANLDYLLPALNEHAPPKMQLMLVLPDELKVLTRDQLQQWLIDIYVHVYNRSPHDPDISTMLEHIHEQVAVI